MKTLKIEIIDRKDTVYLNKNFAKENNLECIKFSHVKFGFGHCEVNMEVLDDLNDKTIQISENVVDKLNIPCFVDLQVKVEENKVVLGPLIGVLLGEKSSSTYRKLTMLQSFTKYYDRVKGAIVGFTIEDMNTKNLTVNGVIYNPENDVWERTTVPFPSSIFKRGIVKQEEREYFFSLYKGNFFNYKKIDKWEIHNRLSQFPDVNYYLPETVLFKNTSNLLTFLNKHKNVYVKPIAGNRGLGIFNIIKDSNSIKVYTRQNHENICLEYKDEIAFEGFIKENLKVENYIIQQTLNLVVKDRTLDFRIGMDKNENGQWKHNMFVTRVGGDESIVSNVASGGGYILNPKEALKTVYDLNEEEIREKEKQLLDIAYSMANNLDLTGVPLGKIALDLAITKEKQIYLIEINNTTPNDNIMTLVDDNEKRFKIRNENILYGKFLAGFSKKDQLISIKHRFKSGKIDYMLFVKAKRVKKKAIFKEIIEMFSNENISMKSNIKDINMRCYFEATQAEVNSIMMNINNSGLLSNLGLIIEKRENVVKQRAKFKKKAKKKMILRKEKVNLENQLLKKRVQELEERIEKIEGSNSWKVTAPLRSIRKRKN